MEQDIQYIKKALQRTDPDSESYVRSHSTMAGSSQDFAMREESVRARERELDRRERELELSRRERQSREPQRIFDDDRTRRYIIPS